MKNSIYFLLLITILTSCKQNTGAQSVNQPDQKSKISSSAGKLEDLTKIDTAAFLQENPRARNKTIFGPLYENEPTEKRIYAYKSRTYFGSNAKIEGSIAQKVVKVLFQDTTGGKKIDHIIESTELKFPEGQSKLEGTNSDDMKIFALATYMPTGDIMMFTVNVNTKDAMLRRERLNHFKEAMIKAGADISKFIFDENAVPIMKEGNVSFEVNRVKRNFKK